MKKVTLFIALFVLICFIAVQAQAPKTTVKPVTVKITTSGDKVLASYNGLKVKVTNESSEFFSHDFFISIDDLKDLAKKRKLACTYNPAQNKLVVGSETCTLVEANPNKPGSMFDVKFVRYNGKIYFDVLNLYNELGFSGYSKTSDGMMVSEPK